MIPSEKISKIIDTYKTLCDSISEVCTFRFSKSESVLFFFHPSYHIEVEETDSMFSTIFSADSPCFSFRKEYSPPLS